MAIRCRNGRWSVYYRDPETQKQKEESFGSRPGAEAAAKHRNKELGFDGKIEPEGPLFGDLAKAYRMQKDFNKNSRKHLKIRLSANILPFFGNKPAISLTDNDIRQYIEKRRSDPIVKILKNKKEKIIGIGVKNSTIRRELTDLQAVLNWAAGRRPPLIPFNPVRGAAKPKPDDAIIDPPTRQEVLAILSHAPEHLKRFIRISWFLGVRPGSVELLSLTWESVKFDSRSIRVISADKGGPIYRMVPIIHPSFYQELMKWKKQDKGKGAVIHYKGNPVKSIRKSWWNTLKKAGITRRLRPYDLRHRFVTTALEKGADIKALAEIVGSSPSTLMRHYQHVTRTVHRQTVALIPDLDDYKDGKVIDMKDRKTSG